MTDYRWSELRDHAIRRYRDVPSANQEQRIIDVFKQRPELVATAVDHVAERFDAGTVSNPWPFLATHVEKAVLVEVDARATDASAKDRAVRVAEQWMRAAGVHHDRESEVCEDLFGYHGLLREWATDEVLRARMVELWTLERPRGEQCELEADERGRAFVAKRAEIAARLKAKYETEQESELEEAIA